MSVGPKSALLTAISEIQNSDLNLPKTGKGQVQSRTYEYLTIHKLHEAVFPKLKERGLVWVTYPSVIDEVPTLAFELVHIESNEAITGEFPLCLAKPDPQGLGSAITYARRYALLALLGLVGDDDDGKAAGQPSERQATPTIPLDRARAILEKAKTCGHAEGSKLSPTLQAKLVDVGVQTGKLGHLDVAQAEDIEKWLKGEASA